MNNLVKTYSNKEIAGVYEETKIDELKKKNNRLVSICGKYHTVITVDGNQIDFENKKDFNNWAKNNDYVTDF